MLIFLAVFLFNLVLTHTYFYRRLVRDIQPGPTWQRRGKWLLIGLASFTLFGVLSTRFLPRDLGVIVGFLTFGWMGMIILMLPGLWLVDLYRGLQRLRRGSGTPANPERRLMLARSAAGVTVLGATIAGTMGVNEALGTPELRESMIPIPNLPAALEGFRIVQISDVHVGPTIGKARVQALVDRANALKPDLVALTGDLVDGSVARLGDFTAPFGDFKSRHGTFLVTGNHEYYSGVESWLTEFRRLGIRVLRNERVTLQHDGAPLDILGTDDWRAKSFGGGHGFDLDKACDARDPECTSVLLTHQPKAIDAAHKAGIDLMICGHTHGGQMWPANILVKLIQPYVRGLHHHKKRTWIYVHTGSGYWGPPMRLQVPAEIALLTLTRA